ncbi:DNA topoisomerase 1 alpha-like [Wolffia australiana]
MAGPESVYKNMPDDDDDEDQQIFFKRRSSISKPSLPNSALKKQTSQQSPTSGKRVISSSSNSMSGRVAPSSLLKVPSNNGAVKHNGTAPESDDSEDDKPLSFRISQGSKASIKPTVVAKHSDDSEDEKPLSFRVAPASSSGQRSGAKTVQKLSQKSSVDVKEEAEDSEDEKPLASRFQQNGSNKRPLSNAAKANQSSNKKPKPLENTPAKVKREASAVKEEVKPDDDDNDDNEDDYIPISQRTKNLASKQKTPSSKKVVTKVKATSVKKGKVIKKPLKNSKASGSFKLPPGSGEGQKWTTLEHCGVIFPPPYKPHGVKILYNGKPVDLTPEEEEVATMFAVMKETEYATKKTFIDNFMRDWKAILGPNHVIKQFELCDFTPIYEWSLKEKEKKKQMTTEEKKALKEEKLKQEEKYMWAIVDGIKEKVGNFRVEPPGLFRGRGEHPKMGKLKRRIRPRDITINIGKDAPIPECPIPGEKWKEIRHDNTVTWLAYWNDPINIKEMKYVFLAASSSLKGQSDKEKYEKARKLKDYIQSIRRNYTRDFTNKDDTKKQVAVATYLIDKLALRAGNEKEEGEEADTVGCCTLKVENVMLVPPNKLQFDFLGKDSIRYFNTVEVEPAVYKAVGELRMKNQNGKKKEGSDPLFHMLDTSKLNAHLKELMPGLTAKVFRTYNASITLDEMLNEESKPGTVPEKLAVYQHANKEVAIICNHQRSVSKSHDAQMSRLNDKLEDLKNQREELEADLSRARKGKPPLKDSDGKTKRNLSTEALEKKISQLDSKMEKIELERKLKEDLKTVALGTSKINYLDPRISVAWCKRNEVPIEKIFNKSLLAKFAWAMDVVPDFRF